MAGKKKAAAVAPVAEQPAAIIAFKGFDKNLQCRGHQFTIGETYTHTGVVVACRSGFHVCTDPFDVWGYYPPGEGNRFARVDVSGKTDTHSGDSKLAVETLRVSAELSLFDFVKVGVDAILKRVKDTKKEIGHQSAATNTGDQSAATNTGYQSAATNTGNRSAATNTGNRSAATNTGNRSAATNTGYQSAATNTGNRSAATNTGNRSAATNTGDQSAATNTGDQSAATNTGDQSAATNTGNRSAATNTGNRSAASVEGKHAVAMASGFEGWVMATQSGSVIAAVERDATDYATVLSAAIGIVGQGGIEPGIWYVCRGGKLVVTSPESPAR